MPSFDIVSEYDKSELANAHQQAEKDLAQRYDFRGTGAKIERTDAGFVVEASSEDRVRAAVDVFHDKLVRRKVSLSFLDVSEPVPGSRGVQRITLTLRQGIDRDHAKEIVQKVKDAGLKVQASIQDQVVRVTGKKKDDLQDAMRALRAADIDIELQFKNFRD
ncbi:MAG: YajQ family cyclic di-GMP-binding protein [Deltaproteobacteria bacterium]|nr:YajQ family cyclic di-GMP-binding protein [Deltaproteobacteria bacterium]